MTPKKMNQLLKILLIVLVAVALGGLYFADGKLSQTANDIARLKAEVEVGERQMSAYQITKTKVDSLDYVQELASKVLPEKQEQSLTVAELSQFAIRARLEVAEITFSDLDKKATSSKSKTKNAIPKGVQVTPVTIKFSEGSRYEYLLEFLKSVEENRRKMQVTNISLTPDTIDRSLLKEVSVDLNLYVRAEKPAQGEN